MVVVGRCENKLEIIIYYFKTLINLYYSMSISDGFIEKKLNSVIFSLKISNIYYIRYTQQYGIDHLAQPSLIMPQNTTSPSSDFEREINSWSRIPDLYIYIYIYSLVAVRPAGRKIGVVGDFTHSLMSLLLILKSSWKMGDCLMFQIYTKLFSSSSASIDRAGTALISSSTYSYRLTERWIDDRSI